MLRIEANLTEHVRPAPYLLRMIGELWKAGSSPYKYYILERFVLSSPQLSLNYFYIDRNG